MLTTSGKDYIATNFGISSCYAASGLSWSYKSTGGDTVSETGGTAQIVSRLVMTALVQSVTINGRTYTYSDLKAGNGGQDVTLTDARWIADNDGEPAGEPKYCTGGQIGMNIIKNPGFELWSNGPNAAPDGWVLGGSVTASRTTDSRSGYAVKVTGSPTGKSNYLRYLLDGNALDGKKVTFRVWVKSPSSRVLLMIRDAGEATTPYSGSGQWEQLTVSKVLTKGNSNELRLFIYNESSDYLIADDAELYVGTVPTPTPTPTSTPTPAPTSTPTPRPTEITEAGPMPFTFRGAPSGVPTITLDLTDLVMRQNRSDYHFEMNDIKITNTSDWTVYLAMEIKLFKGDVGVCPASGEDFDGMDRTTSRNQRIKTLDPGEAGIFDADFYQPSGIIGVYTVCLYIHGAWSRNDIKAEIAPITG